VSKVLASIARHAHSTPGREALAGTDYSLSYKALDNEIKRFSGTLKVRHVRTVGILMDNTPAWAVSDLACIQANIPVVPIPLFFTPSQVRHLLANAGVDVIITDQPDALRPLLAQIGSAVVESSGVVIAGQDLHLFRLTARADVRIPAGIAKVTYTSGTTGDPKGVCLTQENMERVALSLLTASEAGPAERHLCLLPLATLLENIGGIYVPLMAGAAVVLPGLVRVGMQGASQLNARRMAIALNEFSASSCIMIPQMLCAYVICMEAGMQRSSILRYIAVGGAPVSPGILERAAGLGLPVFEGYGLSEAASVTAVNTPSAHRFRTVGRPLPHVRLQFAEDGEILVSGSLFSGYLGQEKTGLRDDGFLSTGDIGHLDEDGFLHITGRKKHIFITAFGRNISPEWVERELTVENAIAQAVVFGEARPFNIAILVPRPGADAGRIQSAVDAANANLPDYARVHRWLAAKAPFCVENRQLTGTGRPRRNVIERIYAGMMAAIYNGEGV